MKEFSWFKLLVGIATLAVAASVSYYFFFYLPNAARLASSSEECQQMAQSVFVEDGYTLTSTNSVTGSYFAHYNQSLKKCFMVILTTPTDLSKYMYYSETLYDALSLQEYAEYDNTVDESAITSTGNNIATCTILQPKEQCSSETDFANYVQPYITQ